MSRRKRQIKTVKFKAKGKKALNESEKDHLDPCDSGTREKRLRIA
jgi:hypothetical protein